MIKIFTPKLWKEYKLIDCGDFEKLEQFGNFTLRRPEPQAVWKKGLREDEWTKKADVVFKASSSHKGEWITKPGFKEPWHISYYLPEAELKFKLSLTAFKHVGIFPEQAENWEYIFKTITAYKADVRLPKILNLFAYTGGASMAAKAAGADVTHVDSVKQVINWANDNQNLSGMKDIRWVVEDAMKFAEREAKRGNLYNGIILDPPAYGIGANGERWKLEEMIDKLLKTLSKILHPENRFLIMNSYSLGFSSLIVKNLLESNFKNIKNLETGELVLQAQSGLSLPLGVIGRFQ
jgi:23S rRNA (cytosine1962-C5)-methyltransferase